MDDFQLRTYQAGDEEHINASFNSMFRLQRSLIEWQWRFHPVTENSQIMLAIDKGKEVVAQFASQVQSLLIDGHTYRAGYVVDAFCLRRATAVNHNIYLHTIYEFYKNLCGPDKIEILYGLPAKRFLHLGRLKLQFADPVDIKYMRKQRRLQLWTKHRTKQQPLSQTELDGFWNRCMHRYPVTVIRDSHWLNRRYFSHPYTRYVFQYVHRDQDLAAWAVIRYEERELKWVDLLWDGQQADDLIKLEEQITLSARQHDLKQMTFWLHGDPQIEKILQKKGWQELTHPFDLHLTAVSFKQDLDAQTVVNNFYITMGDTDIV
jgi:hypothetical protein